MIEQPDRTVVIVNPRTGREISSRELEALLPSLQEREICWTEGPGHASELTAEALSEGADRFVAAGGDGTVHEIVSAIAAAGSEASLGILPLGTGNDFARSLGLPLELEGAARVLSAGRTRRIDLAKVRSSGSAPQPLSGLMVNASIGGLGGGIVAALSRDFKRTWGPGVYLRMALDEIGSARSYPAEITVDGERLALELTNVVVANGGYLGGGIPVAPSASLDDGLLDVVVLPALPTVRLIGLAPLVVTGRQLRSRRVIHRRARAVSVATELPMPVTIDGEPAGDGPLTYEANPGALTVICP